MGRTNLRGIVGASGREFRNYRCGMSLLPYRITAVVTFDALPDRRRKRKKIDQPERSPEVVTHLVDVCPTIITGWCYSLRKRSLSRRVREIPGRRTDGSSLGGGFFRSPHRVRFIRVAFRIRRSRRACRQKNPVWFLPLWLPSFAKFIGSS